MLGKDIDEIRAMPYKRFKEWQLFYVLEPWGWHNDEHLAASIVAMLYNVNRTKSSQKAKGAPDFSRDIPKAIEKHERHEENRTNYENMTIDEKRAFQIRQFKGMLE